MSAKRIRKAIQELFAIDLENDRKEVKTLIIDRFTIMQDKQIKVLSHQEFIERDAEIAKKLQNQEKSLTKRSRKKPVKVKKERKTSNKNSNSLHVRNILLSEPLQAFLGVKEMPRTQVVKSVWDYIKKHSLQNPEDRREIICDEAMIPIFGEKMTMFSMNKILSKHLFSSSDTLEQKKDDKSGKVKSEINNLNSKELDSK